MRILFITDDIDALGGIQTATHTLAQHLTRRGHQVHVVGIYRNTTPATPPDQPTYQRTVLGAPPPGAPPDAAELRTAKQRMRQVLAQDGSGFLIMSSVHTSLWLRDVNTAGYLRIGHYHGSYEYARTHYHLRVINDLWSTFAATVFLSRDDAAAFAAHGGLHTTWIPNPLPPAVTAPDLLTAPRPAAAVPRVLAVGRLVESKRFDLAIAAFAHAAVAGWQLHIIGDGNQEQTLRQTAEQHFPRSAASTGIGPAVVFRGRLPAAGMPAEYAAAQLLMLTSEHEGFGMVIAEAAAAGTPTVAFDVSGGVRSLIHHDRTGLLVPPGDGTGISRALRVLMTDPARRRELGQAARAAVAWLRPETVIDRWEHLLARLPSSSRQEARS